MKLYHKDLGFPAGFRLPNITVHLHWTGHADRARQDDRYGEIIRYPTIDLDAFEVIEVGLTGKRVEKLVIRCEYISEHTDLTLVLVPNGNLPWIVKTCWLNECNDIHATLDTSRYEWVSG